MRDFFKLKNWIIGFSIFLLSIIISSGIVFYEFRNDYKVAEAGVSHNVNGFAWSSNFGWISFNSMDCDLNGDHVYGDVSAPTGCPDASTVFYDYGVNINPTTGNFSGYAWNSNVGWIDFAPSSPYPVNPQNLVKYDSGTGLITGWAKILSLENDGWVKMIDTSIDSTSKEFSGWAWNGDDNNLGVGWISFNCSNDSSCASFDYKVSYINPSPNAPSNFTAVGVACANAMLGWTDNSDNEIGFETQWSVNGLTWTSHTPDLLSGINNRTVSQSPSTTLYYRVRALGEDDNNSDWTSSAQATTSYCAPVLESTETLDYNCDSLTLKWTQEGSGVSYYEVWRKINEGGEFIELTLDDSLTLTEYIDNNIESGEIYYYKVIAQTEGSKSNVVGPITPCPDLPSWREVR